MQEFSALTLTQMLAPYSLKWIDGGYALEPAYTDINFEQNPSGTGYSWTIPGTDYYNPYMGWQYNYLTPNEYPFGYQNIKLYPTIEEIEAAMSPQYKIPEINNPQGVKTPDFNDGTVIVEQKTLDTRDIVSINDFKNALDDADKQFGENAAIGKDVNGNIIPLPQDAPRVAYIDATNANWEISDQTAFKNDMEWTLNNQYPNIDSVVVKYIEDGQVNYFRLDQNSYVRLEAG